MMDRIMQRIKQHMEKHYPPFLNPPATMHAIEAAEREIGAEFPEDIKTLYLTHNGENPEGPGLFFGLSFLPLESMLAEWRLLAELDKNEGQEGVSYSFPELWIQQEKHISNGWIPIGSDGKGNYIGFDLSPYVNGRTGQIINFGRKNEVKFVITYNMKEFMVFLLKTLNDGLYTVDGKESWSYGKTRNQHFFDALKTMELPLFHPPHKKADAAQQWFIRLDDKWKEIIQDTGKTLKEFYNEKYFSSSDKDISDISPLAECKNLKSIILSGNRITDIAPLQELQELEELHITGNPLVCIAPLKNVKGLQSIYLTDTLVEDLKPLTEIYRLRELGIGRIPAADYDVLPMLRLRVLSATVRNRGELNAIAACANLESLHIDQLSGVSTADLHVIGNLKNLKTLIISNSQFDNLDFLEGNARLHYLKLENCHIKDASSIANLENLEYLDLKDTQVENMDAIAGSRPLKRLEEMKNPLKVPRENAIEDRLLDAEEEQNYFIYSTNSHRRFPLIDGSLEKLESRMYKEVAMGYTTLMLLKREILYFDGKWMRIVDSATDKTDEVSVEAKGYCTFLFLKTNPSMESVIYSQTDGMARHDSLEEAMDHIEKVAAKKKKLYPHRTFYAVCAKLLAHYNWH